MEGGWSLLHLLSNYDKNKCDSTLIISLTEVYSSSMLSQLLLSLYCSLVESETRMSHLSRFVWILYHWMIRCWMLLFSIKDNDDYKIITIRPDPLYLGLRLSLDWFLECYSSYEKETSSSKYHPHLFINERGEYECSILETNRIRELLGLKPLEMDDEWIARCYPLFHI